jgi:sigma-B regulation protein RsbU (phosphoserine phosphatase)
MPASDPVKPDVVSLASSEKPFSILVVDDNEANRDTLSRRLQRRGYVITTANDGAQAIKALAERPFDLLLLDVMMPVMNGIDALKEIRRTRSPTQLPVIMATAKGESADVVQALELGANDYVTKPLDFAVVLARVQTQLTLKRSVEQILELEHRLSEANAELRRNAQRLQEELSAAAKIQEAFLPTSLPPIAGVEFAWAFQPCAELAGDALNIVPLDAEHVAFYVLDVTGHGVAASLLAVAAARVLTADAGTDSILLDKSVRQPTGPAEVAKRLDKRFAWDSATGQFITLFYAVLHIPTRRLAYVSCGHPPAIRVSAAGVATPLRGSGMPIGLGGAYEDHAINLEPGERLFLYTDGVTEARGASGELFETKRMIDALQSRGDATLRQSIDRLLAQVKQWQGELPAKDDISVLGLELADG